MEDDSFEGIALQTNEEADWGKSVNSRYPK